MATLTSSRAGSGDQAKYAVAGDVVETIKYTMLNTASATDVLQLCKVQAGARVVNIRTWIGSTATNSYSVGTGDDTGLFLTTASTILTAIAAPTASTVSTPTRTINVGAGLGYSFSAADTIDLRWDVAGGMTGGVVYAVIELHYDGQETA
jgi:hypothetical protein